MEIAPAEYKCITILPKGTPQENGNRLFPYLFLYGSHIRIIAHSVIPCQYALKKIHLAISAFSDPGKGSCRNSTYPIEKAWILWYNTTITKFIPLCKGEYTVWHNGKLDSSGWAAVVWVI